MVSVTLLNYTGLSCNLYIDGKAEKTEFKCGGYKQPLKVTIPPTGSVIKIMSIATTGKYNIAEKVISSAGLVEGDTVLFGVAKPGKMPVALTLYAPTISDYKPKDTWFLECALKSVYGGQRIAAVEIPAATKTYYCSVPSTLTNDDVKLRVTGVKKLGTEILDVVSGKKTACEVSVIKDAMLCDSSHNGGSILMWILLILLIIIVIGGIGFGVYKLKSKAT